MSYETGRSTTADPSVVTDRDTFADFLETVLGDIRLGGGAAQWENADLARFLEALALSPWHVSTLVKVRTKPRGGSSRK